MDPEPNPPPPTVPSELRAAPPTMPTGRQYQCRKVWPQVIGIIGIIVSVGSFLVAIYSTAGPMLLGVNNSMNTHQAQALGLGAANSLLAIVLLFGSIQLLRRRAYGARTLLWWSIGKIVAALVGAWVAYTIVADQLASATAGGPPIGATFVTFGAAIGVAFTLGFSLPMPIFFLVWFTRAGVKADIASWKKTSVAQESAA